MARFWMNLRLKAKSGASALWRACECVNFLGDAEQLAEEILDVRRQFDDQFRPIFGRRLHSGLERALARRAFRFGSAVVRW